MSLSTFSLGSILLVISPAPCVSARLGPHVASAPAAFREQVEALARSTEEPGMPWSCVGGEIDLVTSDDGLLLVVTNAEGNVVSRTVEVPEDVEPLGEALLAKPLPVVESKEVDPPPGPKPERADEATKPNETASAVRVYVSASIEPRYGGGAGLFLAAARASALLPFGAWGGGVWLRYGGLSVALEPHATPLRELCFGAMASRSFGLGKVELRASVLPSLALMTKRPERPTLVDGTREPSEEGHFDFRLGARAEAILPFNGFLRGFISLDGEASPDLLERHEQKDTRDAGFPSFALGFGLGLEVVVR